MDFTRQAGIDKMQKFFDDRRDKLYGKHRNFDKGKGMHDSVSTLSPFTRRRLILESELAHMTIAAAHSGDNEKFLKEVLWRTYWKGYLENFPTIWDEYKELCLLDHSQDLLASYEDAVMGATAIEPFNDWVRELKETGYLHNHARMWFASIWIHTLELPWYLGADFFLKHLLDGDEAVNTLSWRWVAGLHT